MFCVTLLPLFMESVSDAMIRKITGHRSGELERYKHLHPALNGIAGKLSRNMATKTSCASKNTKGRSKEQPQVAGLSAVSGGADGTRTRDLRRDRPAF